MGSIGGGGVFLTPDRTKYPCRALEYCMGAPTFWCDDCPHPEINPLAKHRRTTLDQFMGGEQ